MTYPSVYASQVFEFQLQLGASQWPNQKISSVPEFWTKLEQCVGTHTSVYATNAISLAGYTSDSFVVGLNLQRVMSDDPSGAGNYSGTSSKSGSLLSARSANSTTAIDTAYLTLSFDVILSISESGCEVYD